MSYIIAALDFAALYVLKKLWENLKIKNSNPNFKS